MCNLNCRLELQTIIGLNSKLSSAGRGNDPPAPPLCRSRIVLLLFTEFAKGKKDKIQKSKGKPDTAEAYNGVAAGRIDVVPIGNGAEVGMEFPVTAA
jgi:hypothetical protein